MRKEIESPEGKPKFVATNMVADIAQEIGLEVHLEPEYGYVGQIKTPDGRVLYFRNTSFDLNGQGSADNAKDKGYAAFFMEQMGYPVPEGRTFYSDRWAKIVKSPRKTQAALQYAQELGYPVVVKPNSKSQGMGVEKVYSDEELVTGLNFIFNEIKERVALVQRFVEGDDYRIVVLDKEVIAAYQRSPLAVVGDGTKSIAQLLQAKQEKFRQIGRDTVIKMEDPKIQRKLARSGLNLDFIPGDQVTVKLLDNANLSTGGDAVDVTDTMHPTYKELAIKLSHDMGLRYSGVDILTSSPIENPLAKYCVVEINAAPGLDYYVEIGEKQKRTVREMYKKVLLAMISSASPSAKP